MTTQLDFGSVLGRLFGHFFGLLQIHGHGAIGLCVKWPLVSHTLFVKGLNQMLRGLKVPCPQIVNMILFVNVGNFLK